jgi:hypothetical protein
MALVRRCDDGNYDIRITKAHGFQLCIQYVGAGPSFRAAARTMAMSCTLSKCLTRHLLRYQLPLHLKPFDYSELSRGIKELYTYSVYLCQSLLVQLMVHILRRIHVQLFTLFEPTFQGKKIQLLKS